VGPIAFGGLYCFDTIKAKNRAADDDFVAFQRKVYCFDTGRHGKDSMRKSLEAISLIVPAVLIWITWQALNG